MSGRSGGGGGGGGVRGPTSALTEFLREKNIHIPNANRFARRDDQQEQTPAGQVAADESATASSSTAPASPVAGPSRPTPATRSRRSVGSSASVSRATQSESVPSKRKKAAPKGASMNFDEDDEDDDEWHSETASEEEVSKPPTRGRRAPGANASINVALQEEDGTESDSERTKWTNIHNGLLTHVSHQATQAGAIDYCPGCSNRFTITSYTLHTPSGGLCHKCGPKYEAAISAGIGNGRGKTKAKAKGRASAGSMLGSPSTADTTPRKPVAKKKRTIVQKPQDKKVLTSLQDMCINIISTYIEDVEALGGIGERNIDTLSKSISKNRRLNDQTLQLFLEPHIESLSLYDCSKLTPDALKTIGVFSPRLRTMNLQQCGQLDNEAFDSWTEKLNNLTSLELYGPFLVRKEAWLRFMSKKGNQLRSLKIRESPRFDLECVEQLVKQCTSLEEVGLAQIGPLDGACLKPLQTLTQLSYLDVSDPGVAVSGIPPKGLEDQDIIDLLSHIGSKLTYLNLGGNAELTDRSILEGVLPHCRSLRELRIDGLVEVESDALALLFDSFAAMRLPRLTHVNLKRCSKVGDDCLEALVLHSGPALQELSVNSCRLLTGSAAPEQNAESGASRVDAQSGLQLIAQHCPSLLRLDLSFVRSCGLSDIMALIEGCKKLDIVHVFGCNRIPDYVGANPGGQNGTTKCKVVGLERVPIIAKNVVG